MKKLAMILSFFLLTSALLAQEPPTEEPPAEKPPVHEIVMTAKKYEFNPNEIRVKQGERVRLIIRALDRTHGLEIEEFGIKRVIEEGGQTTVEFVADKAGTFQFKCAKWCGFGHGRMRGTLIVEPAEKEPAAKD